MSLGNRIKEKSNSQPKPKMVSVVMPEQDWEIMKSMFGLVAENVGRLAQTTQDVAILHTNCMTFIKTISEKGKIIAE